MNTYKGIMEAFISWKDAVKGGTKKMYPNIEKEKTKMKKKLKGKEVLGYSMEHEEFSIFKDEKDFERQTKGSGKKMKWIRIESLDEAFNFKSAVKNGFLEKGDEKYVKELTKKGWEIDEFNITSKGFEITVINKKKVKKTFTDKLPELALKNAAMKSKR